MRQVTKTDKSRWGSYADRTNSFDDTLDLKIFTKMVTNTPPLREYLINSTKGTPKSFRLHPDGKFGVDLSLRSEDETIATFDIERWSAWTEDWPSFYRWIHFLGRKEKFLKDNFFMVYMNYNRTKVIIVDHDTIIQYPTISKDFKHKNVMDRVKEIPMKVGRLFGEGITDREKELFIC